MAAVNRLTGAHIRVGEPVPFDCYDRNGQLLLKKGLIVATQRQVDYLLECGLFANLAANAGRPDGGRREPDNNAPPTPFQLIDQYQNRLAQIFSTADPTRESASQTESLFAERILRLAAEIQKLCELAPDAVLGAIHLENTGRYVLMHPLHRAFLCEFLGRHQAMNADDRRQLLAAALTCDLAMLKLQDALSRQTTPLTAEQKKLIESHPVDTVKLLSALGVSNAKWLTTVSQHHEYPNGEGYPAHISGAAVMMESRILTMADRYSAIITPRPYRKADSSKAAMRHVLLKRGGEIDEALSVALVKELRVFPPGAFVKLQNGEVAIVIRRTENAKAPLVKSVLGPRGAPLHRAIARNTSQGDFEINDVVDRDPIVVLNLHQLWDYVAS